MARATVEGSGKSGKTAADVVAEVKKASQQAALNKAVKNRPLPKIQPADTSGMFIGPIPTGSTRTPTGYITSNSEVVTPGVMEPVVTPEVPEDTKDAVTPPARTMAMDTFRETLSGLFAPGEMNQPWVSALYNVMSKYYNSGSTIADAMNLSLKDAENNPELAPFTKRFAPIYALRKRQQNGEAVSVPTIAQYIDSEIAFGTILNETGLGSLATQEFIGSVLTTKSVLGATNLINDIFTRIDNAPSALKSDLTSIMGLGVSRTDIAKALLTGKAGAEELDKKVKQLTVYSAAKSQNVNIGLDTATDLANMGQGYGESLENFQTVKQLERGQALGRMSGRDYTQNDAIQSTFYKNASAAEKERIISEEEQNRFKAKSGRLQSQNRSTNGLI